jgi:hypothetical protein
VLVAGAAVETLDDLGFGFELADDAPGGADAGFGDDVFGAGFGFGDDGCDLVDAILWLDELLADGLDTF